MTRGVLGLIAVLWLNMAVLPCAMALEGGGDCPHCPPPAVEHEMAVHHGHGDDHAKPSCATMQSQCGELEEASIDTRGSKLELKPTFEMVFISTPPIAPLSAGMQGRITCSSDPPDISGSSPPLNVLFCVYLD